MRVRTDVFRFGSLVSLLELIGLGADLGQLRTGRWGAEKNFIGRVHGGADASPQRSMECPTHMISSVMLLLVLGLTRSGPKTLVRVGCGVGMCRN